MLTIKETTIEDIKNMQNLWADGDVMQFVGFPNGLQQTDEAMLQWLDGLNAIRPIQNHFSIYEDGIFCGEVGYGLDKKSSSAWLDIKLFSYARGRGIATQAIKYTIEQAFKNGAEKVWVDPDPKNIKAIALYKRLGFKQKDMPKHVIALGENPATNVYFEFCNTKINFINILDLQPTQFYLSLDKIRRIESWFNKDDLSNFEPLPIKQLNGRTILTDGHTRAWVALQAGLKCLPVMFDSDELDWEAYQLCVEECLQQGISTIKDLSQRILNGVEYQQKWETWCINMHKKLAEQRHLDCK